MIKKRTRVMVTVFGGVFGLHKYMEGRIGVGLVYTFTAGLFFVGWISDIFKAFSWDEQQATLDRAQKEQQAQYLASLRRKPLGNKTLYLDEVNHKWSLDGERFYANTDIVDVEILRDAQTVIKSSTSSTVGRAAVGALLFGAGGAIVGGASSKKHTSEKLTQLGVRMTVKDLDNPMIYINCLNDGRVDEVYSTLVALSSMADV